MLKHKNGQNILEYVIVLTAIVAAVLVGARALTTKDKASGLGKLMSNAADKISGASQQIADTMPE